jgi:hypothetical protein
MKQGQIHQQITIADKVLITTLLVLSVASYPLVQRLSTAGQAVRIEVDGTVYTTVQLHNEQQLAVPGPLGTTQVLIQDGQAAITASPCRAKICVQTGPIEQSGQMIVCVPNKVVVRIIGKSNDRYDAVTR